jgi:DNA-binding PadR family transcriptional regulator
MRRRTASIEDVLPLTPRVLLILWGLYGGPQHPYALLTITEELGRGRVAIGPASLYEAIQALSDKGLIEETDAPAAQTESDPRRKYFRLTRFGRDVLRAEAERISDLAADLRARVLQGPGRS